MNVLDQPIAISHQIHTYTELRQQIHDDLRIQHPEWVDPDGKSPMCDSYESRFMELLATLKGDPTSLSLLLRASSIIAARVNDLRHINRSSSVHPFSRVRQGSP